MSGDVSNILPKSLPLAPTYDRIPYNREYAVRGTLKFEPSSSFNAWMKLSYNHVSASGPAQNAQFIHCPGGLHAVAIRLAARDSALV